MYTWLGSFEAITSVYQNFQILYQPNGNYRHGNVKDGILNYIPSTMNVIVP